jgi:hypothetical protein
MKFDASRFRQSHIRMLRAHARIVFVLKTPAIHDQMKRVAPHQALTPQISHEPIHLPNRTTKYTGEVNIGDPQRD